MDIGIALLMTQHDFNTIGLAQKVEELGFESLWAPEHGIVPLDFKVAPAIGQQGGIPKFYAEGGINQIIDPLLFLAGAATVTKKIKLGTGICLVPERNPIRLAKEVATLDRISNGRFLFGVGAGWLKGESEILGVDFPSRWKQTREYIDVMKELWTTDISEFHGKYIDFPPLICDPKPVQKPHPPVLLGGNAKNVLQRVARWGDGWLPNRATPDQILESKKILETLEFERGRETGSLTISVFGQAPDTSRQQVEDYLNAGALRVSAWAPHCETEEKMSEELERMAENMIR